MTRKLVAEFFGTMILVLVGVGAAVSSLNPVKHGVPNIIGVAAAFGFVLLVMAYAIGPISGSHINPAVSIGFWASGRMPLTEMLAYWVAQILGAIVGAFILFGLVKWTHLLDTTGGLGTNGYGGNGNMWTAAIFELVFTAIFVFVILQVTRSNLDSIALGLAGLSVGFSLFIVHLVGIQIDGTSVNPARSIGPALFAPSLYSDSKALSQLWVFIVFPLLGGLLAAVVHRVLEGIKEPAPTAA
jgi:aquaporin Z